MEVLGATASVATIVEVLQVAVELRRRFKDAPAEFNRLAIRIELLALELQLLLETQQEQFNLPGNCANLLDQCGRSLGVIKDSLASSARSGFGKRAHWALLGRAKTRELLQELTEVEVSIGLVFQLLQWKHSQVSTEIMKECRKSPFMLPPNNIKKEPEALPPQFHFEELRPCSPVHPSAQPLTGRNTTSRVTQSTLFHLVEWIWAIAYADDNSSHTAVASVQVNVKNWIGLKLELVVRSRVQGRLSKLQINRFLMTMTHNVSLDQPFMMACARGDIASVRLALQREPASITYYGEGGATPLSLAIEGGHFEVCKLLLENGVEVNSTFGEKQTSALSWALRHRRINMVRLFMQYGASLHHLSLWGWSPIFYLWSTTCPHPSAKEFLPLLCAADEFIWLHHRLTDIEGWSLLSRCAVYGTLDDVMTLIRYGVDPFEREPGNGWTVLHNTIYYGVEDVYLALFPVFQRKLGIEIPDVRGWTLLHFAIASRKEMIIRHLLENGADWRAKTLSATGDMPRSIERIPVSSVQIAAAYGDERYLEYLEILHDVLDRKQEESSQETEQWFDALDVQQITLHEHGD